MVWATFYHRSSYECGECKEGSVHLSLFQTVSHADRVQGCTDAFHSLPQVSVGSGVQEARPAAKRSHLVLGILPLLRSRIYPPVAVHVSHNGCRHSKTKPSTVNQLYICQQTDHLSLSTTIFCRCQQPSSVAVNKLFNCRRSLNQSNSDKPSLQKRP